MLEINFGDFPLLTTERLVLRHITTDDAHALLYIRSDEKVMEYIDSKRLGTIEETLELIKLIDDTFEQNNGITWGITLKDNDVITGTIGFWRIEKQHHRAEIGYLLHHDYWAKGIMTEAANAVLQFGFNELNLHSIEGNVNPSNADSIKLLERLGFVREAYFKENFYFDGKFLDSAIYSLLKKN